MNPVLPQLAPFLFRTAMDDSLATWVPVPVLVGALSLALGLVVVLVKRLFAQSEERQKERDELAKNAQKHRDEITAKRLETLDSTLKMLGDQSHGFVRVDSLGRLGDRIDERIGDLRERVKVLEADISTGRDRIKEIESAFRRRERE